MGTFIQALFLTDLIIIVIPGFALLALTWWAYRRQEAAGYFLGWLSGLFFIVVLSSLFPPAPAVSTTAPVTGTPLSFITVIMATFLGLMLSIIPTLGIMMTPVLRLRSVTLLVALSTSIIVGSGYAMVMLTTSMRLAVAVFILAYGIGVFGLFMFSRRNETIFANPLAVDPLALDPAIQTSQAESAIETPAPEPEIPEAALTTMERFRLARERFDERARQRGF